MPKVLVLMPIYRTNENYLREAIESIKKSKDKSYKIITFLGFQIKWRLKK